MRLMSHSVTHMRPISGLCVNQSITHNSDLTFALHFHVISCSEPYTSIPRWKPASNICAGQSVPGWL